MTGEPGLAPVAKRMGAYVAQVITAQLADRHKPAPFRYRPVGALATTGRAAAVADFGRLKLRGRLAWLHWGLIHVFVLIGIRRRLPVALQWLWAYVTYQRGARLITSPGVPWNEAIAWTCHSARLVSAGLGL